MTAIRPAPLGAAARAVALGTAGLVLALPAAATGASTTEIASVSSAGGIGNGDSLHETSITPDGRYVAFLSEASNLVPGDSNATGDVFVRDRVTGITERVSLSSAGAQANDLSLRPSISADGRFVAFESFATNLVSGDTNGFKDVFLRDRLTGSTTRRSVSSSGAQANDDSEDAVISADGRWLAFASQASNLVPQGGGFETHVFLHERTTGITTLASATSTGALENGGSFSPSLSADGRYIAFSSGAFNLLPQPSFGFSDVYVRDRLTGALVRASTSLGGAAGFGDSNYPAISANGRSVAFQSAAPDLVAGDGNGLTDVFVRDLDLGLTERVSVSSAGAEANGGSNATGQPPAISADGRFVAFASVASNLAAGSLGWQAIYLRDRALGATTFVSVAASGALANNSSYQPVMSSDGRYVLFHSNADNLVAGDNNQAFDVFLRGPLPSPWANLGFGLAGAGGVPNLLGAGTLAAGSAGSLALSSAQPGAPALLFLALGSAPATAFCGTLVPLPYAATLSVATDPTGAVALPWASWPAGLSGTSLYFQYLIGDGAALCGVAFSNALRADSP